MHDHVTLLRVFRKPNQQVKTTVQPFSPAPFSQFFTQPSDGVAIIFFLPFFGTVAMGSISFKMVKREKEKKKRNDWK